MGSDEKKPHIITEVNSPGYVDGSIARETVVETDEISLKELILKLSNWLKYLSSRWVIILLLAFIGGISGLLYVWTKEPLYTAKTTFVLESGDGSGGGLGQYAGLASMVGIDVGGAGGGGIFQGDNIIELYKSRSMIEKTLFTEISSNKGEMLLIDVYVDINQLREAWSENKALKDIQFSKVNQGNNRIQDSIVGTIVSDIHTNYLNVEKPDPLLSIMMVEVKSIDEFFAKTFNDQIVNNVNDFYVQTKTKKSLESVKIIQHKTDSVRNVMNGAIYASATISDATPNLNPTRQVQRVAPLQRSQFTAETNKAILGELVKNLELSKIALLKETPLIQIIDKPVFPLKIDRLNKIKGFLIGAILASFLTIVFLTAQRLLKNLLR